MSQLFFGGYSLFARRWNLTFGEILWVKPGGYQGIRESFGKHVVVAIV